MSNEPPIEILFSALKKKMTTKTIPRTSVTTIEQVIQTNSVLNSATVKQLLEMVSLAEKSVVVVEIKENVHEVYGGFGSYERIHREYTAMFERDKSGVWVEYSNKDPLNISVSLVQGEDDFMKDVCRGIRTYLRNQRLG